MIINLPGFRAKRHPTSGADVAGVLHEMSLQLAALDVRVSADSALVGLILYMREHMTLQYLRRECTVSALKQQPQNV